MRRQPVTPIAHMHDRVAQIVASAICQSRVRAVAHFALPMPASRRLLHDGSARARQLGIAWSWIAPQHALDVAGMVDYKRIIGKPIEMRPIFLCLVITMRQLIMPDCRHFVGDGLDCQRLRAKEMDPAGIVVEAGVVMPAGQALDLADEAVRRDYFHHAVEREAEEVFGDAQDGLVPPRRRHHLLRLQQQVAHTRLDIDRYAMRQQGAADAVVRRYGADHKSRFHRSRADEFMQVIKSRHA